MTETQEKFIKDFMSRDGNFGMFTAKGNKRVQALVKKCMKKIFKPKEITQRNYEIYVSAEAKKVASKKEYLEMTDTAVRETIYYWLDRAITDSGYEWAYDFRFNPY